MNARQRWQSFVLKSDDQRFREAAVIWTGQGGDITRLPVPPMPAVPGTHVYLLQIENHNYIRFTIIDAYELNSLKAESFNPYHTNGYTARLEY